MSITIERVVRVKVVVTFLRMTEPPDSPPRPLPDNALVVRLPTCSVEQYRVLYNTVGADYVWWLRRTMPDEQLAALLGDQRVGIHVLYVDGIPAGFYELDVTGHPTVNLSYFGLMPHAVGAGLGTPFLRHAVDNAWAHKPSMLTVNTCTADHPRALPSYLRAGFKKVRDIQENWSVPVRLGLKIPQHLKA